MQTLPDGARDSWHDGNTPRVNSWFHAGVRGRTRHHFGGGWEEAAGDTLITPGIQREIAQVFEDLNYEELKRRANARLPDRVVATLEARGERRSVAAGETIYSVDDRQYPFAY